MNKTYFNVEKDGFYGAFSRVAVDFLSTDRAYLCGYRNTDMNVGLK